MTEKRIRYAGIHDTCMIMDWENNEKLNRKDIINRLNEQDKEINDLKEWAEMITGDDDKKELEIKHINDIYDKLGFKGVIDYAMDELQRYGLVKEVDTGLWVMVTGGWSDHEWWLECLNDIRCKFSYKHYCAYERGGAFYYSEKPHARVKIINEKRRG